MRSSPVLAITLVTVLGAGVLLGAVSAAPAFAPSALLPEHPPLPAAPSPSPSPAAADSPAAPRTQRAPRAPRARIVQWSPDAPGPYGVGIVIRIALDRDIPEPRRQRIEDAIAVTTSQPIGPAAWTWLDTRTLAYRPRDFWPAYTYVSVTSSLGPDFSFAVGRSQVLTISAATQSGWLRIDGVRIRRIPVSLGKSDWETRSGVKTVMERYKVRRMTSEEVGDDTEDYDLQVPYAIRLTPTGEFLHAAPWAEARLGVYAGSHGCTNLSMADGRWFFRHALQGDPVITRGTGREMEWWNGPGAAWNVPWSDWAG